MSGLNLGCRDRIGSMRKGLKSRAVFEFVDAPFEVSDEVRMHAMYCLNDEDRCRGCIRHYA